MTDSSHFSRERKSRGRERTGIRAWVCLQFYSLTPAPFFLLFPSSLLASLPPHQYLKNHSHSCCVRAHAGRNYRRSAPGCRDNFKASLCVGTGGTAKFPRPPGEGEGRGREEAEVLEPAAMWSREQRAGWKGHIHLPRDNGSFAGWLWKDTLRTQWSVTHESFGANFIASLLRTLPESHSALRNLVNILKFKGNKPLHFLMF